MVINTMKRVWMVCNSALLCSLLLLIALSQVHGDLDSSYELNTLVVKTIADDNAGGDKGVVVTSSAVKFQHPGQIAQWSLTALLEVLFPTQVSDAYLFTEPIDRDRLLHASVSRFQLVGWKDASLLYKIKNAYL